MAIRVALNHKSTYGYDRSVSLSPQLIRLRPAPHCRTPILSYSLGVRPEQHFLNWQQDPLGNILARVVFHEKTRQFAIEVDLAAEMTVVNPFDFFVEPSAETFPFPYESWLAKEVEPFLELVESGPSLSQYVASIDRSPRNTVDFLVALNRRVKKDVDYLHRLEEGIQTCEETLAVGSGSCRDLSWLLMQLLRHLGLAARFVSGYLIELVPDDKPDDDPARDVDFAGLHAWAEVYLPGAGWIGLDPTSGLLAGEGHIPLACTPNPANAAPVTGTVEPCEIQFNYELTLQRLP